MYQQPFSIPQGATQQQRMSDADLIRLAQLMQQQRGEGLAFINPDEQALLKAMGGAGQPMPGTQGLGPGGGPIRSYAVGEGEEIGGTTGAPAEKTAAEKAYEAAQQGYDYVTGRPLSSGSGDGGGTAPPPPAPPPAPKYKDQYGNEFKTKTEADASDTAINAQKTALENTLSTEVKADTTYQQLDDAGFFANYNKVSPEDIKNIFEKQTRLIVGRSKEDIAAAEEALRVYLSGLDEEQLQTLTFDSGSAEDGSGVQGIFKGTKQEQYFRWEAAPGNRFGGSLKPAERTVDFDKFPSLSLAQQKALFERMRENALREQRFTLTPEERAEFESQAPTVGAVDDAGAPTLLGEEEEAPKITAEDLAAFYGDVDEAKAPTLIGEEEEIPQITADGLYGELDEAEAPTLLGVGEEAPKITAKELAKFYGELDPAKVVTIADVYQIEVPPEVGNLPALGTVKIDPNGNLAVDETALAAIKKAEDYVAGVLLSRISGVTPSQAELQLRQTTEQNLRSLLGAQAGAQADPARLRQIRQIYADTQQAAVGQAALVRTQEQAAAEQQLTEIYKTQGTRELSIALANLETKRQVAVANGELEQARNVAVYQANLQRLITNAEIARDVDLANQSADLKQKITQAELDQQRTIADLNARAQKLMAEGKSAEAVALANLNALTSLMAEQGKLDLATALANLEANTQKLIAEGKTAEAIELANLDVLTRIITEQGKLDLATELANLDANTQVLIAEGKSAETVALANLDVLTTLMVEQGKLDLATALANLQKDLTIATTDADLSLKSKALDDAFALAAYQGQLQALGYETQMDIAQLEADLKLLNFDLQRDLAELDAQTQITIAQLTNAAKRYAADSGERAAILGAIGTVLGAVVTSDVRVKTNIRMGEKPRDSIQEFLDGLQAYLYEYKQPDAPGQKHGEMLGVMAQDLMQSDIGRQMVKESPSGLQVDYGQGLAAILAAQADLNDRLNALEGRK